MKTKIAMTLMIALSLSLSAVYAQKTGQRYKHDEKHRYGYHNGKINRHESRDLARQKRELHKKIRRAKMNDGYVSRAERKQIERDWRAMNRDIYKYKNNRRNR